MAEPVLVIHGVGNPRREPFQAVVARLQAAVGDDFELIDVFWGDLGAGQVGFEDTVPRLGETGEEESVYGVGGGGVGGAALDLDAGAARSDIERAAIIAAAARPTEEETTDPVLVGLILEELQTTVHLRNMSSPEVLIATGQLIAEITPQLDEQEGVFEGVGNVVGRVVGHVDRLLGAALGEVLGRFNQAVRTKLVPAAAGFFGDVFAYEHHRAAIQQRVFEAIDQRAPVRGTPDRPIDVVAHSLGGVITFHAATTGETGRTLAVNRFITFGSQSSLFHTIDPRQSGLSPYTPGNPVPVRSIRRWTNLWEPLDPLAFLAGKVFVLEDETGARTAPRDVEVRHVTDSGFFTHGAYWETQELIQAIRAPG